MTKFKLTWTTHAASTASYMLAKVKWWRLSKARIPLDSFPHARYMYDSIDGAFDLYAVCRRTNRTQVRTKVIST